MNMGVGVGGDWGLTPTRLGSSGILKLGEGHGREPHVRLVAAKVVVGAAERINKPAGPA